MEYNFVEMSKGIHKCYPFMRKSFQFLALVTFISAMYSYFLAFPLINLQFSTLIFPLLGQALDRKFMFLVCNAILAFLAKNAKLTHSTFNQGPEDGVEEQLTVELATAQEDEAPPMDHTDHLPLPDAALAVESEHMHSHEGARERETTGVVLESADWEYYHDEFDNGDQDDEDDEDGIIIPLDATEQATDARVSTEELNKKFEEFIRKVKEEIRVEAQQPLITV